MPPKRPLEQNATTSTMLKKQKVDAARRIHVEPPSRLPLNSERQPRNLRTALIDLWTRKPKGMEGLPATIDIERFSEARSFEIGAMQSAMKNTASTTTHRVWQTLPRHLRRRAASHDVRRVPVRLREKAKHEIDPAKRKSFLKLLKRKKRLGRDLKRSEKFANQNKTWLETHLWHAKRMHMQDIWGYRLAVRPTEKSYRPSHRAAVHGSTLHDTSYMSTIELTGHVEVIASVLKRCCGPCGPGPWAARYTSGVRVCSTHLYEVDSWPSGLIGPITVFWRPAAEVSSQRDPGTSPIGQPIPIAPESRTLWIRVHPASLKSAMECLKSVRERVSPASHLEISDLSGDVNSFELVGPRTSQVIHGAFRLASGGREVGKFWETLANARSPGNFSPGMVVGMTVHDPRLHFPPINAKTEDFATTSSEFVSPNSALAQSELWNQEVRDKLRTPTFKKAALDNRRSKNLVPGTRLRPTKEDDKIPIILIQHTISANLNDDSCNSQPMYGWTILLPPSWSMSCLNSLVHTGTRVVGLAARHHQRLEVNCPHFPEDYVGNRVFIDCTAKQASLERAKWERTPKGKRVNYESLGINNPWASDWAGLTGGSFGLAGELIPTDRAVNDSLDQKPWLLLLSESTELIQYIRGSISGDLIDLFGEWIDLQRTRRGMAPINHSSIRTLFNSAFVHVRLDMLERGNPQDRAIIYGFPTNEAGARWRADFNSRSTRDEKNELAARLDDELVFGFVTSGGFSLQASHGHGIGAISLKYALETIKNSLGITVTQNQFVRVRNLSSELALPGVVTII